MTVRIFLQPQEPINLVKKCYCDIKTWDFTSETDYCYVARYFYVNSVKVNTIELGDSFEYIHYRETIILLVSGSSNNVDSLSSYVWLCACKQYDNGKFHV